MRGGIVVKQQLESGIDRRNAAAKRDDQSICRRCQRVRRQSVLLETLAPRDAIVCAPALLGDHYGEIEYVVDRRRLAAVKVIGRFPGFPTSNFGQSKGKRRERACVGVSKGTSPDFYRSEGGDCQGTLRSSGNAVANVLVARFCFEERFDNAGVEQVLHRLK